MAGLLRCWQVGESLWVDELHTAWSAMGPWNEVARRAAVGNQSPLFYWGEAAIVWLFGAAEWSLRLPSLLAGIALVPLTFAIAFRWTGRAAAASLAALLVSVDQIFVFYAQEARPYAWLQLAALIHLAAFFERLRSPRLRWRLLHVGSLLLAFYLHYTALLLLSGELFYLCLVALRLHAPADRNSSSSSPASALVWNGPWRPWLIDALILAAGLLPALPQLSEIAERRANWALFISPQPVWMIWILFPLVIYLLPTLTARLIDSLVFLKGRREPATASSDAPALQLPPHIPPDGPLSEAARIVPLVCWFLVPIILTWIATVAGMAHLFFLRYVLGVAVALPLITAIHFAFLRLKWLQIALLVLLPLALVVKAGYPWQLAHDGRLLGDRRENWRAAGDWIEQQERRLEREIEDRSRRAIPVFVRSGLIEADALWRSDDDLLRRYTANPLTTLYRPFRNAPDRARYPLQIVGLPTTGITQAIVRHPQRQLQPHEYGWLVLRAQPESARQILAQLERALPGRTIRQSREFGNITVARFMHSDG